MKVDTLIVGAGFSGLCMAMRLRAAGMNSFLVIEKSEGIGGTWWENRYPGCACDIPSHLYSFSFDLNPQWTRMFAGRQEAEYGAGTQFSGADDRGAGALRDELPAHDAAARAR